MRPEFGAPHFVFLCPACSEMLVAVNPRNNLAHCFHCQKNWNNIDLLLACDYNFADAVALLESWLRLYQTQGSENRATDRA